jgi:Asp-tRNA(Asn)/Glu-tRNA(Gln) amidotransferase A subunit family amidase
VSDQWSPVDIDRIVRRLNDVEPVIHAFVDEVDRATRLRGEAERLNDWPATGEARTRLLGVPVGVKDIIRVDGLPTTAGSRLPPALFDGPEASIVTRLRVAGALIVGKTVTAEFAVFHPGPTRNPHNPQHTPGGSSSGSAAAVAAGECVLALGTQTIGSVIRPAAYCGIVGVKPTGGRMPGDGIVPCSPSLDQSGYFTQDVAGALLAASVLIDGWNRQAAETDRRPVLGVPDGPYLRQATPEGLEAFEQQQRQLREGGFEVRHVPLLADISEIDRLHRALMFGEMAEEHHDWFQQYASLYAPRTAELVRFGQTVDVATMERARAARTRLRDDLASIMDQEGIDLWISPPAPGTAPVGITATGDPVMNLPWTNAALPVLTLPSGTVDGLPVGLQVAGRFGSDEALLVWAAAIEATLRR